MWHHGYQGVLRAFWLKHIKIWKLFWWTTVRRTTARHYVDWAQRDDRIRVLHKENGGLVSAWMAGVSMSTGDYLCFVDSDDWIDACMVEKMLDFSSDCGKEIICGNYVQEERNRSIEIYQAMEPLSLIHI